MPIQTPESQRFIFVSGVSWSAVIAGATGAAALSLILLVLGVGLGLSSVSPWTQEGMSAATIGVSTILWLTLTQFLASGMGGYLAGRLRTKWFNIHHDEVYFRDTAHGFLAWAVATLATASLLASVAAGIVNTGAKAGASAAGGAAMAIATTTVATGVPETKTSMGQSTANGSLGYFLDSLFRRNTASTSSGDRQSTAAASTSLHSDESNVTAPPTAEIGRIFLNGLGKGNLPPEDKQYLVQVVAQHTGMSEVDAEKRVTDVYARLQARLNEVELAAKEAADKARKASAYASLWIFISLLIGAFIASWSATFGGRRRDL